MRSSLSFAHPAREVCRRCHKAAVVCVCPQIAVVDNRTRVHIIQHPRERHRAVGTVRFANLGLARCLVEEFSPRWPVPSVLAGRPLERTALLFPGRDARPLESLPAIERPDTLIVLDGTWSQVDVLRREIRWLDALPQLTFSDPPPSRYLIRPEPEAGHLSTIESIVRALTLLEPGTVGLDGLITAFENMVETQLVFGRTRRRSRYIHRRRPPITLEDRLRQERDRLVLTYVETTGGRGRLRLLQCCAQRVATGESLECLIESLAGWPDKIRYFGWRDGDRERAVSEQLFAERWRAFVPADAVLVAWSQLFVDALRATLDGTSTSGGIADRPLILKGVFAGQGRSTGDVGEILARRGGVAQPTGFTGRASRHMGAALALLEAIHKNGAG